MVDVLIVQSKVKELVKKAGFNTGADAVVELSKTVECRVNKAMERAKANGRKTIKAQDV